MMARALYPLVSVLALLSLGAAPPSPNAVPSEAIGKGSAPLLDDIRRDQHQAALRAPKIVGGIPATVGDDKWQVALVRMEKFGADDRRPFCGGVLIDPRWVLTAAHCVDNGTSPAQFFILAGTVDVDTGGSSVKVDRIWMKPGYVPEGVTPKPTPPTNDLALLELSSPLSGDQIATIPLLSAAQETQALAPDGLARVTGWGGIAEGAMPVRFLRFVDVQLHSNDECNDPVAYNRVIPATMVCAGFRNGGKDSCQGDSGGPLTVRLNGAPVLGAIVSWGEGCAEPGKLGVYTRVAPFGDWIADCEKRGDACPIHTASLAPASTAPRFRTRPTAAHTQKGQVRMRHALKIALLTCALGLPGCAVGAPSAPSGVDATLVAVGPCIVAPEPTRYPVVPGGTKSAIDDLATAAITQSVNYIGKALTAAGASKTWTATASRNFEGMTAMPSCVQIVRGNFATNGRAAGTWSAPAEWKGQLPTELFKRGMVLTRSPDFIFEGQIASSKDSSAYAITPVIATYNKPIGTRFFRPGSDRNIALFLALTPGGAKANLDTAPAATITLGKMKVGETRTYAVPTDGSSPYASVWFLITPDSLKKPEIMNVLESETQGEAEFMTFLGTVMSDPKASASVSTALQQALIPSVAQAAQAAKQSTADANANAADQAYAAAVVALNNCEATTTIDVPTASGLASTARATLRTFMSADAKADKPRNTINAAVIDGIGGTSVSTITSSCAKAMATLGP